MALYLGENKIGLALNTIVKKTTAANGTVTYEVDPNFELEDPENLAIEEVTDISTWTRPVAWPNLDNLTLAADFEGVYLTYDNTSRASHKWASFYCVMNTGKYRVALGHMNGNTWVQDSTQDVNSSAYCHVNYGGSSYDYPVFRITPASTNHFTQFYFGYIPKETINAPVNMLQYAQYCVERRGILPYITTLGGSGDNYRYCTEWLEYDNVLLGKENYGNMNLAAGWFRARRLKKINFNDWPTSQWNVTSLTSTFEQCYSLEELDLTSWDTSGWHVTALNSCWSNCYNLKKLNVSTWNTSNWTVTTLANTWYCCYSLEKLDLEGWNTTNWAVTTLYVTWYYCYHLKELGVSSWNTSNWKPTRMDGTWAYCQNLVDIDLSNWNTTGWNTLTRIDACWNSNYKRRNFHDIENWNVSNWKIAQMNSAFASCYRIHELDLSKWNVSGWTVTTLASTWDSCRSLRHLKVSNWDTSNWVVTSIASMFSNCWNLETIEAFNWDTSNWVVATMGSLFNCCMKVKEIDLTKWTTTKWNLTNSAFNYLCCNCYSAKKIDISNLNLSKITTLNNYGSNDTSYTNFYYCVQAEEIKIPSTYAGKINLAYCYHLPHDQIVRIFNTLATALSGAKLTIGTERYKLTTAEIAIATNKGYTVA